jgi:hypothetical protein
MVDEKDKTPVPGTVKINVEARSVEIPAPPDGLLEKWRDEYGAKARRLDFSTAKGINIDGLELIVRVPDVVEVKRIVGPERPGYEEANNIVAACALWPSKVELDRICDAFGLSGLPLALGGQLIELAGGIAEAKVKNL